VIFQYNKYTSNCNIVEEKFMGLETRIFRRRAFVTGVLALIIVYILWNVPQLGFITYPFRLFVTYVHEAGHSMMTLITGGQVVGFTVSPDGTGLATRIGGNSALVLPAGYLGAAFFGAVLFYLIHTLPITRAISAALGIGLIGFSVAFARPDASGLPVALIVGVLSGLALLLMAWKVGRNINLLVLNVLAMMTALNGVLDLFLLAQYSSVGLGGVRNDAAAFSHEVAPILSGAVWALIWAVLALLMLALSAYYSIIRPMLKRR
jgi:hypothetical protein